MSTVLYMSMSLDGFIAGPNESLAHGLGIGGERLHEWVFSGEPEVNRVVYVDDVETAFTQAKEAAGERNVLVHGAAVAQLALAAGRVRVLAGEGGVTHLRYRVTTPSR